MLWLREKRKKVYTNFYENRAKKGSKSKAKRLNEFKEIKGDNSVNLTKNAEKARII